MSDNVVVLGAGIAGLSAGYHLKENGFVPVIYEKNDDWGGLCSHFTVDNFRFDKFVHFSFSKNDYVKEMFSKSSEFYEHKPEATNYYKGVWLRHPAQNNLYPLPLSEKIKIITGFLKRPHKEISEIKDYSEWLECQYGLYFAHNFPFKYTRKYWGVEPKELETVWVGKRMYCPSFLEMIKGAVTIPKKNFYYASVMRYPKTGGYRAFLNNIREGLNIQLNKNVIKIDAKNKIVYFSDGSQVSYSTLFSSIPLPEIINSMENVPETVREAAKNLKYTSGYMVSIGFKGKNKADKIWFYVYDKDIPFARVYSPSIKSPDNVPENCSAYQAEIFFANGEHIPDKNEILEKTVNSFMKMNLLNIDDILVKDIRFEKYANVIFDKNIYKNREIVINYLKQNEIIPIGRFGKWDYLWSDQAFIDGQKEALSICD